MDNLQVLLANIWLAGLLLAAIPSTTFAITCTIHRRSIRSRLLAFLIGGVSLGLVYTAWKTIIDVQHINPVCAGVGDPHVTFCGGHGFVPHEVGATLTSAKRNRDLVLCLLIPMIVGVGILSSVTHVVWRQDSTHENEQYQL